MTHNSPVTDKLDTGRPPPVQHATGPSTALPQVEMPTILVFHDVASLVDSILSHGTDPWAQTASDQVIIPTTVPRHDGLNGGTQAPHNGGPPPGVDKGYAEDAVDHGLGLGTAGGAQPDYATAPPSSLTPPSASTPPPATAPPAASPWALDRPPSPVETAAPVGTVTDEERTRYGLLLDRAAERGLLDSAEYEVRLRQLAEATTTEQMVAIVAELPAFATQAAPSAPHQSRSAIQSASRARPKGATGRGAGSSSGC